MISTLKKLALTGALYVCVNSIFYCAQAALPLEGQTLKVGLAIAPPFVTTSSSIKHPEGIEIDIIKELQRRTGFTLSGNKFEIVNFGEIINKGRAGELDICGGGISLTDTRKQYYDFSYPYFTSYTVLVTNENSQIKDFPDLVGKSITAEKGSTDADLIPDEYKDKVKIDSTSTNFMSFYRVSRGLSDAIVTDEPLALAFMEAWPDSQLKIVKVLPDSGVNMGLLFKKGSASTRILQKAMFEMLADGTLYKIIKEHTGKTFDYLDPKIVKTAEFKKILANP